MKKEIEAFLDYLSVDKGFSENTIDAYKNDLSQLADFFQGQGEGKQWSEVDRQLILSYLLDLKERGYALATIARKTASMKSLFKFLVNTGVLKNAPTENLSSPRVRKTVPQPLSVAQVRELLKQPEKHATPEAKRDRAMLELLYASGMRVMELMKLNVEDINRQEGSVACSVKGSKERNIVIPRDLVASLGKYLDEARPQLANRKEERALFLNRLGNRLTRQGFWQILKSYARESKLENKATLRSLRHSSAAHMLSRGS